MKSLCDICVIVPSNNMQIIEDLHLAMAHSIFRIVYGRISRRTMTVLPQAEPDANTGKDQRRKFDTPTNSAESPSSTK